MFWPRRSRSPERGSSRTHAASLDELARHANDALRAKDKAFLRAWEGKWFDSRKKISATALKHYLGEITGRGPHRPTVTEVFAGLMESTAARGYGNVEQEIRSLLASEWPTVGAPPEGSELREANPFSVGRWIPVGVGTPEAAAANALLDRWEKNARWALPWMHVERFSILWKPDAGQTAEVTAHEAFILQAAKGLLDSARRFSAAPFDWVGHVRGMDFEETDPGRWEAWFAEGVERFRFQGGNGPLRSA
ncbi:hypothetical protein DFJ74DRAFT_667661 [Hyaloraphidium curvatum]|nr:hypothetical protein DFJ74DRAFT_667661 [Hyaloraphidium curvatum]